MKDLIQNDTLTREDVTGLILASKKQRGLNREEVARKIGISPVWTHAAAMGMTVMPAVKTDAPVAALHPATMAFRL